MTNEKPRETLGKIVYDNWDKQNDVMTIFELAQEGLKNYDNDIRETIEIGKKLNDGDFFIVTLQKIENALVKTTKITFGVKLSCPTPTWDQNVYKYHRFSDTLEFIWSIPDWKACRFIKNNALNLPKDQKELIGFVLDFMDGTLDKKCAELNKGIKGY